MLGELPPAIMTPYGYLVGEPWYHNDDGQPVFSAYVEYKPYGIGPYKYAVSLEGVTVKQFRKLDIREVEYDVGYSLLVQHYESHPDIMYRGELT
jgi:hypothetical protein